MGFHVRNDGAFVYIVRADLLLAGSNLHYYALGVRKERKRKLTNREWINSLTNEQMVKLLKTFAEDSCSFCSDYYDRGPSNCGFCFESQVKWLSMEHNGEAFEERDYRYCT